MRVSILPAFAAISPALAGFDTWSAAGPYDGEKTISFLELNYIRMANGDAPMQSVARVPCSIPWQTTTFCPTTGRT